MTEYSPLPGTLRSNTREVTDEPWTKNTTGRAGSPAFGAPIRLRNIHKGMSPFLVQYSLLQISPPSVATAVAACAGIARGRRGQHQRRVPLMNRAPRQRMFGIGHGSSPSVVKFSWYLGATSNSAHGRFESKCALHTREQHRAITHGTG